MSGDARRPLATHPVKEHLYDGREI